jgi:hypothetical protein
MSPTQWSTLGAARAAGSERGGRNVHVLATTPMTIKLSLLGRRLVDLAVSPV